MSPKKKEENPLEVAIANTLSTLETLREEYSRRPSKPLNDIITSQELSLMEMKRLQSSTL